MAVTRLKRKHRKNIARANNKQRVIKQLLATPVIKNVDVEELKAQFGKTSAAPAATTAPEPTSVVESVKEAVSNAAHTVADKVSDVVEAVKDKVEDVLKKDDKEAAE
ncbi:hypothetical protein AAE02nite_22430 [Adhaeribacter aerolatus]|uniref:Uncharacterized protein n=1 Tax=Adhaeribacter aerolatus TaxID=670289 RepID=A0A512AXZ5_9BACT|nr:hypothetical protein [Adhaeribacter aerolatus]GEO04579.1 hypothetical protein AAE02nite_22430 [Adhaeribacter aerolatus]